MMPWKPSRLAQIIDDIYAAAVDPASWQTAVESVCQEFPDGRGVLLHHDLEQGTGTFSITAGCWDAAWIDAYNRYYSQINPWLKNLKKRPVGLAVPAEYMFARQDLLKTQFYNDFLKPQNTMTGVGVTIEQNADRFVAISVLLSEKASRRETKNVSLLQYLAPHFRRAMQINHQLTQAREQGRLLEAGFDHLTAGFALLDKDARVTFSNAAAERIFAAADGLRLDGSGRIVSISARTTATLRKYASDAANFLSAAGTGGTLRAHRPSGRRDYHLLVAPLRPQTSLFRGTLSSAALFIRDPEANDQRDAAHLCAIFGITPAEARILRQLLDGHTIKEIHDRQKISVNTIKTHMKNLFSKLGCTRQSELIRLVLTHPTSIVDEI